MATTVFGRPASPSWAVVITLCVSVRLSVILCVHTSVELNNSFVSLGSSELEICENSMLYQCSSVCCEANALILILAVHLCCSSVPEIPALTPPKKL